MAEAAPLAVGIDTLAGGTVSAAVCDVVRSVTDPRALTRGRRWKVSLVVTKVATAGPGKRPS